MNEDLCREREKCSFNVKELTTFIDGGELETRKRKEREDIMLSEREVFDGLPEEYMGHKDRYENAIKKSVLLFKLVRRMQDEGKSDIGNYRDLVSGLLGTAVTRDGSPLGLHYIMFMPALLNQASEEQQAEWLPKAWNCSIIGTYAQTELGHGTWIQGLETIATYEPASKEFILNSPTLTSYKWWPGGLGQTANYSIVVAQLFLGGQKQGTHSFIVQLRDEETHMPLPGIKVGDIGAKLGLNAVNNGFLGFENVRIPRRNMLSRHADVMEDGTYVKKSGNSKLKYGAMVFVRVVIVFDMVNYLSKAVTIATRYSAVRRQSEIRQNEPEPQILDFLTQQHKLFIGIASCHAFRITANKLWDRFHDVNADLYDGKLDNLPELHALSCCLKAVCTSDTTMYVERCRLACGGHGYMQSSNLPLIYGLTTAACTYEGENTVLLLQTARFLVKWWKEDGVYTVPKTIAYLKNTPFMKSQKWDNSTESIIQAFQFITMRKVECCVDNIDKRIALGMCLEDAWNMTSIQLVAAAEAYCRAIILSNFHDEIVRVKPAFSTELAITMDQMVQLYATYWALEKTSDLLRYATVAKNDIEELQMRYEDLLSAIRPNAVGLVDAFDISDDLLQSTLGSYDGRVYERLMEEAMKSPLNAEPVNKSFHQYLKPFMQGKL